MLRRPTELFLYAMALVVIASLAGGCTSNDAGERGRLDPTSTHHELQATLWVQTAAENRAIKLQAFNAASANPL